MTTKTKINTGAEYIDSLRHRQLSIYCMGEKVGDPTEHPIIRPSINALAKTYDLAVENPELASVISPFTGERISRFLHICTSVEDLALQNKMQRRLGQLTGTCFQRCVGMDAFNALYSVTFEIDEKYKNNPNNSHNNYHQKFKNFLTEMHRGNLVVGGAMTDVKGDRARAPHQQTDPDLFLRVVERTNEGVYVSGAKAHQTGCINSHWLVVMPTMRLSEKDKDYAIVGAIPVEAAGITYIYGRQSCDTRSAENPNWDVGNVQYGGQEALVIFERVFIPNHLIFLNGETDFAAMLVQRFTSYHRRSYVCKTGLGDVLIGASSEIANMNGAQNASHIKDKLIEMNFLNETIFGLGLAASNQGYKTQAGNVLPDEMLANVCKHHVTKLPYEMARLAQDLAGGLVATLPSAMDFNHPDLHDLLKKYLKTRDDVDVEARMKILRLIENLTLGRNAVGYLTESMHGAGSPQAQRIEIGRLMQLEYKQKLAAALAGIAPEINAAEVAEEIGGYLGRALGRTAKG